MIYLGQGAAHLEGGCGGTPGSMGCLGVRHPLFKDLEVLPVLCGKPGSEIFLVNVHFLESCQYQTGICCGRLSTEALKMLHNIARPPTHPSTHWFVKGQQAPGPC